MMRLKGHRYPTRWNLERHNQAPNSKRKREDRHTVYIPTEIIFKILLFMPANVLHEVMRYVCKQWCYGILNDSRFITAHSKLSPAAHIIQSPDELHQVSYIQERLGADTFKVTQLPLPFPADLSGSLDGLLVLCDATYPETVHLLNLVTGVKLTLPPALGLHQDIGSVAFAITSSGHYKVLYVPVKGLFREVQLRVFTIGVDKAWRSVHVHGISFDSLGFSTLFNVTPHLIAGFLYWCCYSSFVCFALDVDTETVYQFSKPDNFVRKMNPVYYLSLGACLGLVKGESGIWRLWKLRDVKSNEWSELAGINITGVISKVDKMFYPSTLVGLIPIMLIDGELWFYRHVDKEMVVVRYNLTNESFVYFPIKRILSYNHIYPHVHTLVSPKKCYPGII